MEFGRHCFRLSCSLDWGVTSTRGLNAGRATFASGSVLPYFVLQVRERLCKILLWSPQPESWPFKADVSQKHRLKPAICSRLHSFLNILGSHFRWLASGAFLCVCVVEQRRTKSLDPNQIHALVWLEASQFSLQPRSLSASTPRPSWSHWACREASPCPVQRRVRPSTVM